MRYTPLLTEHERELLHRFWLGSNTRSSQCEDDESQETDPPRRPPVLMPQKYKALGEIVADIEYEAKEDAA